MPSAPSRPCTYPGCRALVRGASRCSAHPYARVKGEYDAFYSSPAWRKLRAVFIRRHPLCAACGGPAKHVDHVLARKDAPHLELEWANLQALCVSCHAKKTVALDGAGWVRS